MATTDDAMEDFTTATSDGAIGSNSSCVVVVVSCCATDWSGNFLFIATIFKIDKDC